MTTNNAANIPTGASGTILQGQGIGTNLAFSTSTYPSTNALNTILYASSANVMSALATATNGVLITDATTGIPSISSTLPSTVQGNITTVGTISSGTWNGTSIDLAHGGTNANLTASNGGIFYSTGTAGAILAGTATASKMLLSGASTTPTWSTSTIPTSAGATANKVLLSDGTNYALSTPTFPNASATTRKIIVSDGTNWVASTETYAVPGTSGHILTSDGTNWTSAVPATSGTVTSVSGTTNQVSVATGTTTPVISLVGPYTPSTFTVHGVLVGATTSSIVALAAGTAGQVLQSGGASADPVYSTATYPAATVGSGKILYDNGTNFVASTPTFPASASATTRKIIVSDGTNWVASTETYATPGSSGNVLTSDGTNWTSSAATGGGTLTASGSLTNAQIKALHATPVQLLAAPGSGKVIDVVHTAVTMNYGGTNAFTAGASQTINLYYGTTVNIVILMSNAVLTGTQSTFGTNNSVVAGTTYSSMANTAVNLYNATATEITGNAANDNTISYSIIYRTITIP